MCELAWSLVVFENPNIRRGCERLADVGDRAAICTYAKLPSFSESSCHVADLSALSIDGDEFGGCALEGMRNQPTRIWLPAHGMMAVAEFGLCLLETS